MPGFGLAPWGRSSMFGYGSLTPTDPRATVTIQARQIDPATRDYVVEGRSFKADTPVRQQIVIALASNFASGAAVPKLGLTWEGEVMDDGFDARIKGKIRHAVRHLTDVKKNMRIIDIVITKYVTGSGHALLGFLDLTSPNNKPQVLKIPFRLA